MLERDYSFSIHVIMYVIQYSCFYVHYCKDIRSFVKLEGSDESTVDRSNSRPKLETFTM